MNKILSISLAVLMLILALVLLLVPARLEQGTNQVALYLGAPASAEAQALHQTLICG